MKKNFLYQFIDNLTKELRVSGFTTVTFGDMAEIDLDKQSAFPVAHIVIPDAIMNEKTTQFNLDLIVIDLVDFTKDYTDSENVNFNVDNVQDVLQELIARVQRALKFVDSVQFIDIVYPIGFNGFKENFTNSVAGWTVNLSFVTPNMADLCKNFIT